MDLLLTTLLTSPVLGVVGIVFALTLLGLLILPRQESFASLHILTRRASEGSEALPSLARRVRMSFFGARVIALSVYAGLYYSVPRILLKWLCRRAIRVL